MPSLTLSKILNRDHRRPTLRERAAALKGRAARLIQRTPSDADPQRRAVMAGGLAAAIAAPLPAMAAAPALGGPHPDQALLDAEAAWRGADEGFRTAVSTHAKAATAYERALGACPPDLIVTEWENEHVVGWWT